MKKQLFQFCLILFMVSTAFMQNEYYEEKLTYDEGMQFGQMFGVDLATNGEDLVISNSGDVHFYSNNENGWIEYQMIAAPIEYSAFGFHIQLDGETLYVGAQNAGSGKIYIYSKIDGYWYEQGVIEPEDTDAFDFSMSFYFGDDLALIRALDRDEEEDSFGVVFIYQFDGQTWNEIQRIDGDDSGFGNGLFIEGDLILISEESYGTTYIESGAVHCYYNYNGEWQESILLTPSNPAEGGGFGKYIVRSSDFIFIGAPGESGYFTDPNYPGLVYVYRYENDEFIEVDILSASDAEGMDKFGSAIDVSDSTLVIPAYKNDDGGSGSGSAYIFKLYDDGQWAEFKKICPSDMAGGDMFGWAVAIDEDYVYISSPMKDNMSGAVYIFDPHDNSLHANFAANINSGGSPLTVQFTALPQGNPTGYEWDFYGEGEIETSTEQNPEFTYNYVGLWDVTLTVYDEYGEDTQTKEGYIQVVFPGILFGDVNMSGSLDVLDLVVYVNIILGFVEPTEYQLYLGDIDHSGEVDINDLIMVIDEILGF